jgi:hypothetical protein
MDFKPFPKIERLTKASMNITQKIHGTNAQVFIWADDYGVLQLKCGSRTRWITPEDDNYGFAAFVDQHRQEFIDRLGVGQHFGEWAGLGINSGEGLNKKVFVLFDFWKYLPERVLPPGCCVVPVLYQGAYSSATIDDVMNILKKNGSMLSPGFMRPEGVVIQAFGVRYKKVFEAEDTRWKAGDENAKKLKDDAANEIQIKYGHLFQPIRLEKLLSRDSQYVSEFPVSMPRIVEDYFKDLVDESQISGSETEVASIKKLIAPRLFKFIRMSINEK